MKQFMENQDSIYASYYPSMESRDIIYASFYPSIENRNLLYASYSPSMENRNLIYASYSPSMEQCIENWSSCLAASGVQQLHSSNINSACVQFRSLSCAQTWQKVAVKLGHYKLRVTKSTLHCILFGHMLLAASHMQGYDERCSP